MESVVMRRILKLEQKNRETIYSRIEKELIQTIDANGLDLSNTVNIALEKYLTEKGYSIGGVKA